MLGHKDHKPINAHFTIIQLLNLALAKALPFIDLSQEKKVPGSLAYLLCKYRGLIFDLIKNEPFNRSLSATSTSSCQFDLLLSRPRARKFAQSGQTDHDAKYTVFAQAFRVIHPMDPKGLRRDGQLYNTKFMGEYAQDAGGPYR